MQIEVRAMVAMGVFGLALATAGTAFGQVEFESFSEVENVCPDCDRPPADEVALRGGETIRGTIVAKNEDFWVVERYGEVRGIPEGEVESTSFEDDSRPSDLQSQDQIVLKNGHVLTGEITDESDEPPHYEIESSVLDVSYVVFKEEAKALYRGGSKEDIEIPEETGNEGAGSDE